MSSEFKDPTSGWKFDPTPFDKEITSARSTFDSTITEAGMGAGMAAGIGGMNAGRVTADVYTKAMSERDKAIANLEGQKATAQTNFNQNKMQVSAQARQQYEMAKPGFWDYFQGAATLGIGIATMNPWGIFGGATQLGTTALGATGTGYKQPGVQPNSPVTAPKTDYSGILKLGPNMMSTFKGKDYSISMPKLSFQSGNSGFWNGNKSNLWKWGTEGW